MTTSQKATDTKTKATTPKLSAAQQKAVDAEMARIAEVTALAHTVEKQEMLKVHEENIDKATERASIRMFVENMAAGNEPIEMLKKMLFQLAQHGNTTYLKYFANEAITAKSPAVRHVLYTVQDALAKDQSLMHAFKSPDRDKTAANIADWIKVIQLRYKLAQMETKLEERADWYDRANTATNITS